PNPQPMSAADAVDRVLSTSFIAALPEEEHKAVADEIWDVIEPIGRSVVFPYTTQMQAWRVGT
ncbi:MAG: hypothetical protein AAF467_26380, partial [Actinomycetota bacterium]